MTKKKAGTITAYKGFNPDWTCNGYQYEVGKTFKMSGDIKMCERGFHACENPLDVLTYYPPTGKLAVVEMAKVSDDRREDSKLCSAEITIKTELSLPQFIQRGVDYILDRVDFKNAKESASGSRSAATNTGSRSAATNTGDWSAATNTGDRSAATNTGDQSAATNTGYRSAATNTGDQSAATNTGYQSAATNTGDWSAATNTGDQSAATNTGDQSAATNTGDQSAATVEGKHSVAIASGYEGRAAASEGSALVLVERDHDASGDEFGRILNVWSGIAGRDGIKPDTFYTLNDGKPVEVA